MIQCEGCFLHCNEEDICKECNGENEITIVFTRDNHASWLKWRRKEGLDHGFTWESGRRISSYLKEHRGKPFVSTRICEICGLRRINAKKRDE